VHPFAVAGLIAHPATTAPPAAAEGTGLVINVFWVLIVAANFLVFLVAAWYLGLRNLPRNLAERRARIEQALRDADQARQERENAAAERLSVLAGARAEAEEILARAQKLADENRERDMAETRSQLEQMRERAAADITAEKERALSEVRGQVAELALAAAARVVGGTIDKQRERRLVEEFLAEVGADGARSEGR
jgi:F-type H+-transporting ATPase subunit b